MTGKNNIFYVLVLGCILGLTGCKQTLDDVAKWKAKGQVNKLIRTLSHEERSMRLASVRALGQLKAEVATEPLSKLLNEPDQKLAIATVEALTAIGGTSAENHLITALELEERQVCIAVIEALGSLQSQKAVEPLLAALETSDNQIASSAAMAIGQICGTNAVGILAQQMDSHSYAMRLACVQSFKDIDTLESTKAMAKALGDINPKIREFAIEALVEAGASATPYVLTELRGENTKGRASAVTVLERTDTVPTSGSDQAWFLLAQAPEMGDLDIECVEALAAMGKEAAPALLEGVAHNTSGIREHAFRALETIGRPCVVPAVLAVRDHASDQGKKWFEERSNWAGAPCWQLDLWGAATVLNPQFSPRYRDLAGLEPTKSAYGSNSSTKYRITRAYVPLLIGQTSGETSITTGNIDLFGSDVKLSTPKETRAQAKKWLLAADNIAVFPLIAALDGNHEQVASTCADLLGRIGDKRAMRPLAAALDRKVKKGNELTYSAFYTALQQFDDPEVDPILARVRPNIQQATRIFERQYPGFSIVDAQIHNETADYSQPVGFTLDYAKKGSEDKEGSLRVIIKRDREGSWVPTPALPNSLP